MYAGSLNFFGSTEFPRLAALDKDFVSFGKCMLFHSELPHCVLCKFPIQLEEVVFDDWGKTVHEDCYIRLIAIESSVGPVHAAK